MNKKRGNGEGSITFHKASNRYMAQYTTADGQRKTMYQRKNESITKPKSDIPNKEIEALTLQEHKKLLDAINKNDKVIMGDTTKTLNSKRTILIDDKVKNILRQAQKKQIANINGLIFYDNTKDTYITPNEINNYLKRLNKKENITSNLHTHMLRHTYATRCIESGMQAKALQKILGHKRHKDCKKYLLQ